MPDATQVQATGAGKPLSYFDEYWAEYYRPPFYSSFKNMFVHNLADNYEYMPFKFTKKGEYDLSPFRIRDGAEHGSPEKGYQRRGGPLKLPGSKVTETQAPQVAQNSPGIRHGVLPGWLQSPYNEQSRHDSIMSDPPPQATSLELPPAKPLKDKKTLKDKAAVAQWTLDQFVTNSLNPTIADSMAHEYQRYINHPSNLPLVLSTELPPKPNLEFISYVNSLSMGAITTMFSAEDDLAEYADFLDVGNDPLTVTDADFTKKRYKAYRQWVKGKSLFKQRVDP